jgi:hypothetical protein
LIFCFVSISFPRPFRIGNPDGGDFCLSQLLWLNSCSNQNIANMKIYKVKLIKVALVACMFMVPAKYSGAQDLPGWATKLPVEKGFVFGVGNAGSPDMLMAKRKAMMNAQSDLARHYTDKFEVFAMHCDTLLGTDTTIRSVVTVIHSELQATLTNVIVENEKVMQSANGQYIYYILVKMDIHAQKDEIKSNIENKTGLKQQMKEKGLLDELKDL